MDIGISASCMTVLPAFFSKTRFFHALTYKSLRSLFFSVGHRSKGFSGSHNHGHRHSRRFVSHPPPKTRADLVDENVGNYKRLDERNQYEYEYPLGRVATANKNATRIPEALKNEN